MLSVSDEEDPAGAERQWDALKGELLEEGLTKPEVEAHKLTIRAKIQEAIDSTEIHDADGTCSAQSTVDSFSSHSLREKQTEVTYQSRANLEQRLASKYHSASETSDSQQKGTATSQMLDTVDDITKEEALSINRTSKQDSARRFDPFNDGLPPNRVSPIYLHHWVPSRELVPLKRRASEISEYHEETTEYDGSGQIKKHTVVRRSSIPRTVQSSSIHTIQGGFGHPITPPSTATLPLGKKDNRNGGISNPFISAPSYSNITVATPVQVGTPTQAQHKMTTLEAESGPIQMSTDAQAASSAADEEQKGRTSAPYSFYQIPREKGRKERETAKHIASLEQTVKKLKGVLLGSRDKLKHQQGEKGMMA